MTSGPSASLFALPLASWQQPQSTRTARYEPRKRRRKLDDWGDEEDAEGETTDATSAPEVTTVASSLVLSPEEAHQYRIAGLPFDQELPGGNFPHAAAKEETPRRATKKSILQELSSLSPPIFVPQSAAQQGNLRLQHLAVITAILHRCLLEGDYIRAGRAWGLILREEFAGNPIDVRNEARWGIGAEILLRRDRQIAQQAAGLRDGNAETQSATGLKTWFTRKGFEDAKEYYERLILQYPYRKAAPDAISSLDFYPAMFGLWIYVVQEESNIAREELQHDDEESSEVSSEDEDAMSGSDHSPKGGKRRQRLIAAIRAKELEQAQQIAGRMDELMVSPPYSDSPELLRLRGMVSLWIGDLFVLSLPQENDDRDLYSDQESISPDELPESIQARREQRLAMEKKDVELKKSRDFFEKARQRGKGVAHSLEDFHIDDTLG